MIDHALEDRRYSELYQRGYGIGPIKQLLRWSRRAGIRFKDKSILDCGCGNAAFAKCEIPYGKYVGLDISSYQIEKLNHSPLKNEETEFIHGSLDQLPFEDGAFDIAWCCDVLEHIVEEGIDEVLSEMVRVSSLAIFSICTRPSIILDSEGHNLHPTVKHPEWWKQIISTKGIITQEQLVFRHNIFIMVQ